MSRTIPIGELIQSGLLGGAGLYNQQASRNQQGAIANRELDQRELIRNDRLVEAEFQREQERQQAMRMLEQENATASVWGAMRQAQEPVMGPQQPGVVPPDPVSMLDATTVARADSRAQGAYGQFMSNRQGWLQTRDQLQRNYQTLKSAGVLKSITRDEFDKFRDYNIEFEPDQIPYAVQDETEQGQANIRDATFKVHGGVWSPEEITQMMTLDPRTFNTQFAKQFVQESEQRKKSQQDVQRINSMPEGPAKQFFTQFYSVYGTLPTPGVGGDVMAGAMGGGGMGGPSIAEQRKSLVAERDRAEDIYRAINGQKSKSGTMVPGLMRPPTPEQIKIYETMKDQPNGARYDPPGLGNAKSVEETDRIRAAVEAYLRWNAASNELVRLGQPGGVAAPAGGQPMPFGGGGADYAPAAGNPQDDAIRTLIRQNPNATVEEIEAAILRGTQ
jgi:hypothetical protein